MAASDLCQHARALADMVRLPVPGDARDWVSYLVDCAAEAERLSHAFARRDDLKAFLSDSGAEGVFDKPAVFRSVGGWRKGFGARILDDRYKACVRLLATAPEDEAWNRKLLALADSAVSHPPRFREIVAAALYDRRGLTRRMVISKTDAGDRGWLKRAYEAYRFMQIPVLDWTLRCGDSDLMCEFVRGMTGENLHYVVAGEVFHKLDSGKVVAAVRESGARVLWSDVINNHRLREQARRSDPGVPPLDRSFYAMVLGLHYCDSSHYSHHQGVMTALDAVVEMHRDGRVSRDELDGFRDRLFAMADVHGTYLAYRYLLEDSKRLLGKRFAHAVIPFAMAGAAGKESNKRSKTNPDLQ